MACWLWIVLYAIAGLVVYIACCVINELDCKKDRREMSIESYFNFSWTFFFWPIAVFVGILVCIFWGIICLSKAIATTIDLSRKEPLGKDEPNPNEVK